MTTDEARLNKAITWTVFELQASLVVAQDDKEDARRGGDEANTVEGLLAEGLRWLTSDLFQEVVVERANDGKCGWPCCSKTIAVPSDTRTCRIDFKTKKIMVASDSRFYCSSVCMEDSKVYTLQLDNSLPTSRKHTRELCITYLNQVEEAKGSDIDQFIEALSPSKTKGNIERSTKVSITDSSGGTSQETERKIFKRLKPRAKKEDINGSRPGKASSLAFSSEIIQKPQIMKITQKVPEEIEDKDEEGTIMTKNVVEKSNPKPPEDTDSLVREVLSMSIERYTPYRNDENDETMFLPPAPPSVSRLPDLLAATAPVFSVDFSKPEVVYEQKETIASGNSAKTSTFAHLWSALNQLFGHLKTVDDSLLSQMKVPDVVRSNAVAQLLERGIKSAEIAIDVKGFFARINLPEKFYEKYTSNVQTYISSANTEKCPSLSSTQWKTLGIVLIDSSVLTCEELLSQSTFSQAAWDLLVSSKSGRTSLDPAGLFMMREFFSQDIAI